MKTTLGERTFKKYRGKMATGYEAKRRKQIRWSEENKAVETMLSDLKPSSVLDCPVGTGRFFYVYRTLGCDVCGLDSSEAMLKLAERKIKSSDSIQVKQADARDLSTWTDKSYEVVVTVRFLDLIDEKSMQASMKNFMRIAERAIVCTIRFGAKYAPKSNTAEHDEKKFKSMIKRGGFKVTKAIPVFSEGWHILQMERVA